MQPTAFLVAAGLIFVILVVLASYYTKRARKQSKTTWAELMERLIPVDSGNVSLVARDLLGDDASGEQSQVELDPSELWDLIDGMRGLEALEKNCDVLIDMAAYVQQWHPEAIVVAEQLRNNAREVKWHIDRLRGSQETGNLQSSFPDYAQRAVAVYFTMTQRLLALYSGFDMPALEQLQQVM